MDFEQMLSALQDFHCEEGPSPRSHGAQRSRDTADEFREPWMLSVSLDILDPEWLDIGRGAPEGSFINALRHLRIGNQLVVLVVMPHHFSMQSVWSLKGRARSC
jgi:hypothetical protein